MGYKYNLILYLFFLILLSPKVYAPLGEGGETGEGDYFDYTSPESYNWAIAPIDSITPFDSSYLQYVPDNRKAELTSSQLATIPPQELGDLGQYNPSAISQVLETNYGATVSGDLQGATIINDILSFPDGSTIDLSTGEDITITSTAGTITLETPTVTVEGGHGVTYSANSLTVDSAAEIHDTTTGRDVVSTNPASYARTESGTTIASADFITVDGSELHSVADIRITNTPSTFLLQAASQDDNNPFRFNSGVTDVTAIISKNEVIQAVYGGDIVSFVL